MKIRVILNPMADRGRAIQNRRQIQAQLAALGDVELVTTDHPGHGVPLAQAAVNTGADLVVAAGGDGTVNEVVNGLIRAPEPRPRFGIIPLGSGNDFAFAMGLPIGDVPAAAERLRTGAHRAIDLAHLRDNRGRERFVANAVGIGFDAAVNIEAHGIRGVYGFPLYLLATLRTLASGYRQPNLAIQFDDRAIDQQSVMLTVGLGPRTGGGFHITPDARHDDGWLDSCLVASIGRLTILALLPRVMRGTHITSPHVALFRSRVVRLTASEPVPIHVDGEIYAAPGDGVTRLTVECLSNALRIIT